MQTAQISLKNIVKTYGKHQILDGISLDIKAGDFICIFGRSGGGKTTILNIMGTLDKPDSGEVSCFMQMNPFKHRKIREKLRRDKIAYLFQNFALVEKMTVEENMKLATRFLKEGGDKKELIQKALLQMGLESKLHAKVYELSGGEQQRLALARNMVKPFDILLADEPTGSLDSENKKIVIETLLRMNEAGKTIVVVSHDKDFERIAKKSYRIEEGRLKEVV